MSYSSLIIRNGEDLKFMKLLPNSLFTGEEPLELPVYEGDYCLNVSSTGARVFTPIKPFHDNRKTITFTEEFNDSNSNDVESKKQFIHINIPNGKYLMLINAHIYTDRYRLTIPKYALSVNGDGFYESYIKGFTANITTNTVVDISDSTLTIDAQTVDCDHYAYSYFKITLIPVN